MSLKTKLWFSHWFKSFSLQLQKYFEKSMISRKVSIRYVLMYRLMYTLLWAWPTETFNLFLLSAARWLCGKVCRLRCESSHAEQLEQREPTHRGLEPLPSDATEQPEHCTRSDVTRLCHPQIIVLSWINIMFEDGSPHYRRVAIGQQRRTTKQPIAWFVRCNYFK